MVEDGSEVKARDRLVEFDPARLIQTIEERRLKLRQAERGTVSRSSDLRARARRLGARFWVVLAVATVAFLFLSLRPSGKEAGPRVEVKRADLVLPPVAEVDFKIAFLAPEGQAVKKGDSILRLDTEKRWTESRIIYGACGTCTGARKTRKVKVRTCTQFAGCYTTCTDWQLSSQMCTSC